MTQSATDSPSENTAGEQTIATLSDERSLEEIAAEVFGAPAPEKTPDAPAKTEEQATTETAPVEEAKSDPQAEKIAARIAAASRAERRAAEQRREIEERERRAAERERELDAKLARYKVIEEDPVRAFEELKLDPKTFLEKLAGEYKPENVIQKEVAALRADLEKEREERKRLEAEHEKRTKAAEVDAQWREASTAFVTHVTEQASKYPHLVEEYTEQQATDAAFAVLTEVVAHDRNGHPISRAEAYRAEFGDYPDNDVIAEYLDAQAKARIDARAKSAWRKRGESAPQASQATRNGDLKAEGQPVKAPSPRTLTSRAASEKASAPKQWSQEWADEESLRILETALRKA